MVSLGVLILVMNLLGINRLPNTFAVRFILQSLITLGNEDYMKTLMGY